MSDLGFQKRLNAACDGNSDVPPYGQGRQTWVQTHMGVSHEAVRKWFKAEARPRPDKMRELANLLGVDEAWLSLGITPGLATKERRSRNAAMPGAINVFMGLLQLNGSHCATPSETDPAADYVSFYAIKSGAQAAYHVALATWEEGFLRFTVPVEYASCVVMGAVHVGQLEVDFLQLTPELIGGYGESHGGYFTLDVIAGADKGRTYITCKAPACVIKPVTRLT